MTTLRPSALNLPAASDRLTVSLGDRSYDILVQKGLLDRIGKELTPLGLGPSAVIITNPIVKRLYAGRVIRGLKAEGFDVGLIVVPEGEVAKTMQWLNRILDCLVRTRRERQTSLIALGGGVVG
ncbi:MAG: hypothetical protein E6I68_12645, partial [Chloroflexi bacterium]